MIFRLIALSGPAKGERFTVDTEPMTLGRSTACTVCVPDEEMAEEHAVVEQKGDSLTICDLGSMGQILVNNHETRKARLKHGDMIEIGRTRFLVEAVVSAEVTRIPTAAQTANRVLSVAAFVTAPVVFLMCLAFVEKTFLGVPAPKGKAVASAVTNEISGVTLPVTDEAKTEDKPEPRKPVPPVSVASATSSLVAVKSPDRGPVPPVVPPSVSNVPPVSDDIREVKEDLANLKNVLKGLTNMPVTTTVVARTTEPVPVPVTPEPPVVKPAPAPPKPAPPKPVPVVDVQAVRISSVEQTKFQDNERYDEMRTLEIRLAPEPEVKKILTDSVQVEVSFFDQNTRSGDIVTSRALVPKAALKPEGEWLAGEVKLVTASYIVPKGVRKKDVDAGRPEQYYGYVVRVYYHGRLQGEEARPKTLLGYSSGVRASAGNGKPATSPARMNGYSPAR